MSTLTFVVPEEKAGRLAEAAREMGVPVEELLQKITDDFLARSVPVEPEIPARCGGRHRRVAIACVVQIGLRQFPFVVPIEHDVHAIDVGDVAWAIDASGAHGHRNLVAPQESRDRDVGRGQEPL